MLKKNKKIKIGFKSHEVGLLPLSKKGFTLLEAVVATSIVMIGIIGILIVSQDSVLIVYHARDRLTAAYLAKEGMEIVRNIRDDNWLYIPSPTTPTRAWNAGLLCASPSCHWEAQHNSRTLTSVGAEKIGTCTIYLKLLEKKF